MPSSAGQKLPAELWRHSHSRHASSSPVFISGSEMQASPGLCEDFKQPGSPSRKVHFSKTQKKHLHASGRGNSKPMSCRGSSTAVDDLAVSAQISSCSSSADISLLSQSADSDSNVDYSSRQICDAFAMDAASPAPHPSQVPLPPIEWLKSTPKSPLTVGRSLQVMLGCHVAA
ncbi:uncharacterized protein LOC101852884 [Aplysia californica]|uniref:Uncharacterized protein LOC101852884 n=1 Tax=Aplysia californica TaxID=6500 RepID=A0ABM0K724_APLCA|nr:uncharacterized protein LOC101852884 [Aplysia californica]